MNTYYVTANGHGPVMLTTYGDDISDDAVLKMIKQTLKRARKDNVSISAITVQVNDDGASVNLHGTEDGRYS